MDKFEYKVVILEYNLWTGTASPDYLEVINEYGAEGWRFVEFTPNYARPKGSKGVELIFERKTNSSV